jgi:hypothetical protein
MDTAAVAELVAEDVKALARCDPSFDADLLWGAYLHVLRLALDLRGKMDQSLTGSPALLWQMADERNAALKEVGRLAEACRLALADLRSGVVRPLTVHALERALA